jgi:hypothetical protein
MEVKGSVIVSMPLFIKENFGSTEFNRWIEQLPDEARNLYKGTISPTQWYPLKASLSIPTQKICAYFYNGDLSGASACGKYSADHAQKGFTKLIFKSSSPEAAIRKACEHITSSYTPCSIEIVSNVKGKAVLCISSFSEMDAFIEARICGWLERTLDFQKCANIQISTPKSLVRRDPFSQYVITWA